MNPEDVLISFSLALYSQWFYHKPTRCLFDCGEGVATALGKKTFAIRQVFLSHGHEDHIAGISNLVNVRNLVSGEHDRPLSIYYPKHDRRIDALIEYVEKKQAGLLRYPLYVQPLEPGDEVEVEGAKRPTIVRAFEMPHIPAQLCLGYEVAQERKVINDTTGQLAERLWPILLYTGDGYEPNYRPHDRVDIAIHEGTFITRDAGEAAARVEHRHCTVEKAIDWAASNDVKTLILCHVSDRYEIDFIIDLARAAKQASGFRGELFIASRSRIIPVLH